MNNKDKNNYNFPNSQSNTNHITPDKKTWSNVRGYGNLSINHKHNFYVEQIDTPWNRIQPLHFETSTPIETKYAWSPPLSQIILNNTTNNCNLCNTNKCNNCIHNYKSNDYRLN